MNRTFTIVATLAVALLLGAGTLHAETESVTFQAPFEFSIGDRTFPQGQYRFVRASNDTVYRIVADGKYWGFVHTITGDTSKSYEGGVVFTHNGLGYDLTSFSLPGYAGIRIPTVKVQTRIEDQSVGE